MHTPKQARSHINWSIWCANFWRIWKWVLGATCVAWFKGIFHDTEPKILLLCLSNMCALFRVPAEFHRELIFSCFKVNILCSVFSHCERVKLPITALRRRSVLHSFLTECRKNKNKTKLKTKWKKRCSMELPMEVQGLVDYLLKHTIKNMLN